MTVDLEAIKRNTRRIRASVGSVTFVAALKSNAYGFGLVPVAEAVLSAGANVLAVANVREALTLRDAGIDSPIIIYGGTRPTPVVVTTVASHRLMPTLLDRADAEAFANSGTTVSAMLKVDVGLERLGVAPDGAAELASFVQESPNLELAGVYTHMHVPDGLEEEVIDYCAWQFGRFVEAIASIEAQGIEVPLQIAASSSNLRISSDMNLNAIDIGSLLFGIDPPGPQIQELGLEPALVRLSSTVTQVKEVERRGFVEFSPIPTGRTVRLGVIPFGIADGMLALSVGHVLVDGQRAGVMGVHLEHARINLSGIDVHVGDEVVVIGSQGDERITVRDVVTANALPHAAAVPVLIGPEVVRRYLNSAKAAG